MGEIIAPEHGLLLPVRLPTLNPNLPTIPDAPLARHVLLFNGAWIPDEDPLKIGAANFADLANWRYTPQGLEGIQGYSRITSTPLARPGMRSGIHFQPNIGGAVGTIFLVQAYSADLSTSAVYQHLAAPPGAGNFEVLPLWTDSTGAGLGRFTVTPDGNVAYCNGADTTVWGSTRHRIAAFVNYDPAGTFRYDVTERMLSDNVGTGGLVTLARDASNDIYLLVGSTRPLQGIYFGVTVPNTGASTTTVEYWSGSAWTAVAGLSDGTAAAGVTFAQSGVIGFTTTVTTAAVRIEDERLLYFYRVKLGATGTPDATIQLFSCRLDMVWQPIVDIWDGVERTPVAFFVNEQDFTLDILDPSSAVAPIAADLNGLVAGKTVVVGFEERMTALQFSLIALHVNTAAAVMTAAFWTGTAWNAVSDLSDGTASAGVSLAQTGLIAWSAPANTSEYKQTFHGRTGYFYRLTWNATLTAGDIFIDLATGIPAQRWNIFSPVPAYRFPFVFGGRVMLAGLIGTGELNRIDYSAPQRPDVWNGEQSSGGGRAMYVGDDGALTSALEMSNRFAGNATAVCLLHKAQETWLLQGNAPENFTIYRISRDIGNPAPLSLALAEIPFAVDQQAVRTVALWCSAKGPVMSEGSVIVLMRFPQTDGSVSSIETFFRPLVQDVRAVNPGAFAAIRAWYDPQWSEYNLLIPSGTGQTTCNLWLCCDLIRRKWFKKVPTLYPQMGIPLRDVNGAPYTYGGIDSGHLLRLENGASWDGSGIVHSLETADIPYQEGLWDITLLRYLKAAVVRDGSSGGSVVFAHAADGSGSFVTQATLNLNTGTGRYVKLTTPLNLRSLTHQWRITSTTTDSQRSPRLLGLSCLFRVEREELVL